MKLSKLKSLLLIALGLTAYNVQSQITKGTLEIIKVHSPSIEWNKYGDSPEQDVAVYLPPTYETNSNKSYPVLYFLPGYYDKISAWISTGIFQGFKLKENMDKLINEGAIKEMIVVIPNSFNFMEGSFYTNSTTNGNWEDFYVQELPDYIKSNYRVIDSRDATAIAGHSMGGSGALDLSMKHSDVFSIGYGLCSGLLAPNWVEESPIFDSQENILRSIELWDTLATMEVDNAHTYYTKEIDRLRKTSNGWLQIFGYAYGSAFAGDSSLSAPYFQYPYYLENDEVKTDSVVLADWEDGFGDLENKIDTYKSNLLSLKAYVLDYGINDYFRYIVSGHNHYHNLLNDVGIPHAFINNGGDHESRVERQIENSILPMCDSLLEYDWDNLNSKAEIIGCSINKQLGETIIDADNKKITVTLPDDVNLAALAPVVYTSVGAKLEPASRSKVDFSNREVEYSVLAEDGISCEKWKVLIELRTNSITQEDLLETKIFPNPFSSSLVVSGALNGLTKLEIYDMSGKLMIRKDIASEQKLTINTETLQVGCYSIKLYSDTKKIYSQQLIKL